MADDNLLSEPTLANPLNEQVGPGVDPFATPQAPNPNDYLTNFDHNTVLQNPAFLDDARKYYEQRDGEPIWSDDDLRQKFMADRTFKNMNSIGIAGDLYNAATQGDDMNAREGRLQQVYQQLPDFWQKDGRGMAGLGENLAAMALDPVNLLPLGEVAKVAQGVDVATKAATAGRSALVAGLQQGAAAAGREGVVMGALGGAYDALGQERDITLGIQPGFNWAQFAESAGTQAALLGIPAGIGGTLRGAAAAAARGRTIATTMLWRDARGGEVARLNDLKTSAAAHAAAGDPDLAAQFNTMATQQGGAIAKMDQAYRELRGAKADEELGLAPDEPAPDETQQPGADPQVDENKQRLLAVQKIYNDELQNPHTDPNSPLNAIYQRKVADLDWALNYDQYAATIQSQIDRLSAAPKGGIKEVQQINALRATLNQRGAMRDALLRGAPKTDTEIDQVLDAHGLGVGPNRGYGVDVYGQQATPAREGVPYPLPSRAEGEPPAGAGAEAPSPAGPPGAGAPAAPTPTTAPGPEAPPPAPPQAPPAAPTAPGPAPAPAAGGGGGAGGGAAAPAGEAPAPPEIAAAVAETPAASAAEVAAETPKEKLARLKTAKATKADFTPTAQWQEVPEGAVLPAGSEAQPDPVTGKQMARIAPHPIAEAPTAVVATEASRLEHSLVELVDQVHDTKSYKYTGKSEGGKLSMEDALGKAGYDSEAIKEITGQIKDQVKGVPATQRAAIQREMLSEAIVAKQIEKIEGTLEAANIEPSTDILKATINAGVKDQRFAATAMRVLDGRSRLRFDTEEPPVGNFAEDFLRQMEMKAGGGEDTLHDDPNGMSREQRRIFTGIARKETEKKLASLGLSLDAQGRFYSEAMHFNDLFLSSTYLPGSHEGRLGTYRQFLDELGRRYTEQQAGRTTGPTGRALGERGASAGGEARFGNPDEVYKKNPLRPERRAGIPGILKKANQSGFIGRGIGKADIGSVGEARASAQINKWRDVRAITLKERYATADGKDMKPGEVVYYNPITDKAYADPLLAGRRRPEEPGAQPTGGQTVIPAVPSPREEDIAKAVGIDPVEYATRLRDLEPRSKEAEGSIETEAGETLPHGTRYFGTKDGGIYKDIAELRAAVADQMKEEPPPPPAAAPASAAAATAPAAEGPTITPEQLRQIAIATGIDPAALEAAMRKEGVPVEGPVVAPAPLPPDLAGPMAAPENWAPQPGRKLSIRNTETGQVRTLSPAQRTIDEMLAGKPRDGWEIGSNKNEISSGQQAAAREDFIKAGEEPAPLTQPDDVVAVPKTTDPGAMLSTDEASQTPLAEPIVVKTPAGKTVVLSTALEAAQLLRELHTVRWPSSLADLKEVINNIEVLTKAVPGVKQPSVTRTAAREALSGLFEKMAPDQLHLALDAIRRIPGVDMPAFAEMDPNLAGGQARGVFTGFGARQAERPEGGLLGGGTIGLADPANLNSEYPLITVLHHELGHWGYDNILSDEDRLTYMKWVRDTYYTKGKLNQDLIDATMPTRSALRSPQEMFAAQFQRWVATNGKSMPMPQSLMQKFASYLAHFIDRWFGSSTDINRAMEPLFAKIMPDPVADSWLTTLGSEGTTDAGKALVESTRVLDRARYLLETGLTSSDHEVIERGIQGAMNAINRGAETLGRERTDAMVTRLADIIRESSGVTKTFDPRLQELRARFAERGLNPEEMWNALPDGERRVLQSNFENGDLVSVGSNIELENGDWLITSFDGGDPKNPTFTISRAVESGVDTAQYTRNELARMGAGHAVPQDQHDMTRLVLTDNPDPVLAATKAANQAHQVLSDAFAEHNEAFNRVEGGGSALRVDNPTTLPAEPLGSTAKLAVGNQIRLNEAIKLFESAKSTADVMGVEHFIEGIDEIARVTGRTGMNVRKGTVGTMYGGVARAVWRNLPRTLKQRGRELVDEAYRLFTDHNAQTEAEFERQAQLKGGRQGMAMAIAEGKEYARNTTVTTGSMTDLQRAQFDALIQRAMDLIPDLHKGLDWVRRKAEGETRRAIDRGAYTVRGKKVDNDVQKTLRAKKVAKAASTKRPRPQDEIRGLGAAPDVASYKAMTDVQLADGIVQHGARSKTGLQLGAELLARDKTTPFLPHVKPEEVPNDIMMASTDLLGVKLKTAIESGDKKTADQVRWEALRRTRNYAIKRGIIDTADADVVASINREMGQTMGVPDHVGVPEGAPALVKETLARFTHRKADVQTALRTTMYRLFNLGGITDTASREGITTGRLFRLAGREVPGHMSPTAPLFDIRDPAFSEVRSAMRKLVGNFAEGKGDPGENISNMVEMVLRSGLLDSHEYGAIHDGYNLTYDGIKGSLEGSHVVPPARRPDAWFADHVTEYLMGERGTAEMFKPDENAAAPGYSDVVKEIKTIAERVKDATAYVVNGLMHDDMRREFPALTDYGDVFEQPRADQLKTAASPAGMEEQGMLNQHAMDIDAPRLSAILINMMVHSDETLDMDEMPRTALVQADAAEKGGAGPRTNKLVAAGVGGFKALNGYRESLRYNLGHLYKRGSDLMREYGMKWWGDKLNPRDGIGIYHKITVQAADYLMPLYNLGHQMPDAPGRLKGWLQRNQFWKEGMQPESHANVVEALRGMKAISKLTSEERELHNAYRGALNGALRDLKAEGVQVGDVGEYYFPQVVNTEAVLRDREGAIRAWGQYLYDESRSSNSVLANHLSMEDAKAKAADILDGMTNNDGVYMPPKAERRASRADSIDHQRMFKLHEVQTHPVTGKKMYNPDGSPMMRYAKAYEMMKPYMQNGLEPVGTKYFSAAARRLVTTRELGVNSHAYFDYMHMMQGGEEDATNRAVHLLSTDKVIRHNYLGQSDSGGFEEATRNIVTYRKMTPVVAAQAMTDAMRAMGDGKTEDEIQAGVAAILGHSSDKGITAFRRADAIMHGIADLKNQRAGMGGLDRDAHARADASYRLAMQKSVGSQSNIGRKTTRTLLNFNSLSLLGFTTLSSLPDLAYPLIRSGELGATFRAWKNMASDPSYRAAMRNTGIKIEQLSHDRIGMLYGGEGSKFTRAFFNLNMLTHWDGFVREMGGAVAWEAFKAEQKRALRSGPGTRAYRMAETRLKRYGLDHYLTNGRDLDNPNLLDVNGGDPDVRQGIVKFVNELVFSHTPDDVPLWTQTPLGKLAFQLKAFPTMMGRMVLGHDGVMHRAGQFIMSRGQEGSLLPLVYMLTMGTGLGMSANAIKDIVQGRGGDTQDKHALRDRKFSEIAKKFGWDANVHGPADSWLGNYAESFMMLGGLGFISDMLYQAGQSADNGAWGYMHYMEGLLGPSAVAPRLAWEGAVAGKDVLTGASTPAKGRSNERTFVGDMAHRIPVFGGVRSVTSYLTNQLAGPPNKPGGGGAGGAGSLGGSLGGGLGGSLGQ
jgi:hypothetical protein